MSGTEQLPAPTSYADIAGIHGRRTLLYREFGSYQGEWLMVALGDEYAIYKGWYGSCSGCDHLQAEFGGDMADADRVRAFADEYRPFALIPRKTAANLARRRSFKTVFPANMRGEYSDVNIDQFSDETELIIALEEDMPLTVEDALRSINQETRRRIFEKIGVKQVISEVVAHGKDTPDTLVRLVDDGVYLHLHDASTDREYLLRVPPDMRDINAAKAWTFGISQNEYAPLIET